MQSNNTRPKISCVIPAYNEEKRIAQTLSAVAQSGNIDEIIVVDDGSIDATAQIVQTFAQVRLLTQAQHSGKSAAVARGIAAASGDWILFMDADLVGLTPEHVRALLEPVIQKKASVVLSMRENSPRWMKGIGVDCMTGERVLPRSLLTPHLNTIKNLDSFGLEVFENRLIIHQSLRIQTVYLHRVHNVMKWNKGNFWRGVKEFVLLWRDIFKTISPMEFVLQNVRLRKLLL